MRADCVAFPISTRNSAAAVAHLIKKTGVSHILVGREQAMQDLIHHSLEALMTQHEDAPTVALSTMPTFEELYLEEEPSTSEDIPAGPRSPDTPSLILHSSGEPDSTLQFPQLSIIVGSTAFPKPITFTLGCMLQIVRAPCYGDRDLVGQVMSLHGNPMYHGMGFLLTAFAVRLLSRVKIHHVLRQNAFFLRLRRAYA